VSESPEVAAAREAYREACVGAFEHLGSGFPEAQCNRMTSAWANKCSSLKAALDAALLAQRDRESDKEAVGALAAARMTSNLGTAPDIIRRLRAAGWRLVRSEPAQAPEAKASPNGQQEAVQSPKAGVYCDECGQALR
jgi:hypothetical protein